MRTVLVVFCAVLCACSNAPKPSGAVVPPLAHLVTSDGTPVAGAPEPEVVQLKKIEMLDQMVHVTVGNVSGDYVLVCSPDANKEHGVRSCLSPRPQRDYLLFRASAKWLIKGAGEPMSLQFMQDWSVSYNGGENVGLLPARKSEDEVFGVYRLLSWTARRSAH